MTPVLGLKLASAGIAIAYLVVRNERHQGSHIPHVCGFLVRMSTGVSYLVDICVAFVSVYSNVPVRRCA
jgi:hypothetical protein